MHLLLLLPPPLLVLCQPPSLSLSLASPPPRPPLSSSSLDLLTSLCLASKLSFICRFLALNNLFCIFRCSLAFRTLSYRALLARVESRSSTTKARSEKRLLRQPPSGADIHSAISEATLSSFVSWLMDRRGNTSMALSSSAKDRAVVGHVFSSSVLKILRPPLLLAPLGSCDAVTCQELPKLHIIRLASICRIGPVLDAFKFGDTEDSLRVRSTRQRYLQTPPSLPGPQFTTRKAANALSFHKSIGWMLAKWVLSLFMPLGMGSFSASPWSQTEV